MAAVHVHVSISHFMHNCTCAFQILFKHETGIHRNGQTFRQEEIEAATVPVHCFVLSIQLNKPSIFFVNQKEKRKILPNLEGGFTVGKLSDWGILALITLLQAYRFQ